MPASELPKIVFVGPRAAGKSSLAKLLAGRLGCDYHDTDALLAASVGCSAGDFLATKGEVAFRAAEQLVVRQALVDPEVRVLALGGWGGAGPGCPGSFGLSGVFRCLPVRPDGGFSRKAD